MGVGVRAWLGRLVADERVVGLGAGVPVRDVPSGVASTVAWLVDEGSG